MPHRVARELIAHRVADAEQRRLEARAARARDVVPPTTTPTRTSTTTLSPRSGENCTAPFLRHRVPTEPATSRTAPAGDRNVARVTEVAIARRMEPVHLYRLEAD